MVFLSDLDGTLIDKEGKIHPSDVQAIHTWTAQHSFGLVTGRDKAFCLELMKRYSLDCDYLITNNGANAYAYNQCVYSSLIDLEQSIQICKSIIVNSKHDIFYTNDKGERFYPIHEYGKSRFQSFCQKNPSLNHFSDIDLMDSLNSDLTKISLYIPQDIDQWLKMYRNVFKNVEVMKTSSDYIEITSKGTNKWTAFKKLNLNECAFIGDGENDRLMLENLENTYVMKHAPKEILSLGVNVDCVAQAIQIEGEKYV